MKDDTSLVMFETEAVEQDADLSRVTRQQKLMSRKGQSVTEILQVPLWPP